MLAQVLTNENSFATTLLVVFLDTYTLEGLTWSPETIRMELEDDFNVKLPHKNFSRLMAAIDIVTTDRFFNSVPDFIDLCNILSGDDFNPEMWNPADSLEVAWGVTEASLLILNQDDDSHPEVFSPDVLGYIEEVFFREGFTSTPQVLNFKSVLERLAGNMSTNLAEYAPEEFEMAEMNQHTEVEELETVLRRSMASLLRQLAELDLKHGDTKKLIQKLTGKTYEQQQ